MRLASLTVRSTASRGRPSAQYAWFERKSWTASTSIRVGSSSSSMPSPRSRRMRRNPRRRLRRRRQDVRAVPVRPSEMTGRCAGATSPEGVLEPDHPLPLVGAGAVAILRLARAALPLRPPDPLQVVDLDHDEDRDRYEELRLVHPEKIARRASRLKGQPAHSSRGEGLRAERETTP